MFCTGSFAVLVLARGHSPALATDPYEPTKNLCTQSFSHIFPSQCAEFKSTRPQLLPFRHGKEDYSKSLHVSNSVLTLCSAFSTSCLRHKQEFEVLFALPHLWGMTSAIARLFSSFNGPCSQRLVLVDSHFCLLFALPGAGLFKAPPSFDVAKCLR